MHPRFPLPRLVLLALLSVSAASIGGCQDEDDGVVPWENTRVSITSDPEGGIIEVDGTSTGRVTPATLSNLVGLHTIVVRLEANGVAYGYRADVDVRGDSVYSVTGPLMYRCERPACPVSSTRETDLGNVRVSSQANGALFTRQTNGQGLRWPVSGTIESYASTGLPLVGMITARSRDTLALGIYDTEYLTGRPQPVISLRGDTTTLRQSMWIVPPTNAILNNMPTVRGIEVEQELLGHGNSDVVLIRLTFRNITDRTTYRAADPVVPPEGLTFEQTYLGFALDPDIGKPEDDMITYEPTLDMVYAYDHNFLEEGFNPTNSSRPGLVGLRLLEAPPGASSKVLNAWPRLLGTQSGDWHAGTVSEPAGFGVLNGWESPQPDFPGQHIGYTPTQPGDYRMWVGAGPLTLAPGDAVSMTVAVIMAWPAQGQFTSGQQVEPGNPTDAARQIRSIAETLLQKAQSLSVP